MTKADEMTLQIVQDLDKWLAILETQNNKKLPLDNDIESKLQATLKWINAHLDKEEFEQFLEEQLNIEYTEEIKSLLNEVAFDVSRYN